MGFGLVFCWHKSNFKSEFYYKSLLLSVPLSLTYTIFGFYLSCKSYYSSFASKFSTSLTHHSFETLTASLFKNYFLNSYITMNIVYIIFFMLIRYSLLSLASHFPLGYIFSSQEKLAILLSPHWRRDSLFHFYRAKSRDGDGE